MIVVWGILSKGTTLVLIEESKLFSDYYGKPSLIRCLFEINMLKDNLFLSACVLSRFFFFCRLQSIWESDVLFSQLALMLTWRIVIKLVDGLHYKRSGRLNKLLFKLVSDFRFRPFSWLKIILKRSSPQSFSSRTCILLLSWTKHCVATTRLRSKV